MLRPGLNVCGGREANQTPRYSPRGESNTRGSFSVLFTPVRRHESSCPLFAFISGNQPEDRAAAGHILSEPRCLFSRDLLFHNILIDRSCAVELRVDQRAGADGAASFASRQITAGSTPYVRATSDWASPARDKPTKCEQAHPGWEKKRKFVTGITSL